MGNLNYLSSHASDSKSIIVITDIFNVVLITIDIVLFIYLHVLNVVFAVVIEHIVNCFVTGRKFFIESHYMFQCYSLKSSHPRLLPQSPKDCSIHLCLFCCLAYRVIITIFLNSIKIQGSMKLLGV